MKELIELHSEVKQYAVYAHYYEGIPFYIGSGIYHRDNISKSRAYDFFNRGPDWFDYCDGETYKIKVQILFTTNDRKLAFDKEGELTKTYIEEGYKLANKNFGTHPSEEWKRQHSITMSGENHPMYGKRGKDNPNYGKNHSDETIERMSLVQKGRNNPMHGKKHTKEARNKMSEALKGENHPMYGKKHSDEARNKMSEAKKGKNNPRAKKVLIINNENGGTKVFGSIKDAYEFVSQNGLDKTQRTLQYHLNKGSYDFKNYTIELTK